MRMSTAPPLCERFSLPFLVWRIPKRRKLMSALYSEGLFGVPGNICRRARKEIGHKDLILITCIACRKYVGTLQSLLRVPEDIKYI